MNFPRGIPLLEVLKPGAALVIEGEGMPHKEERWWHAGTCGDPWGPVWTRGCAWEMMVMGNGSGNLKRVLSVMISNDG